MNFIPSTVLIINIRLIGDVIFTTPLIAMLKDAFPGVSIDVLANRGTAEFLEKDERVRRVIYSEKWKSGTRSPSSGYLKSLFRKYDLSICMNASDRGNIAAVVAGRRMSIGYYDPNKKMGMWWRKLLLTHAERYRMDNHVVMRCRDIAQRLGIKADRLRVQLFWDSADAAKVSSFLENAGAVNGFFVIHPFARWKYKYWDIKRFVELSDLVSKKYGLMPVWTSSPAPEEIEMLHRAAEGCKVRPSLVEGTFSLNQIACLLDKASLYLGLDTAVTHIAAAAGIPVVALYGPTDIWGWHPWDNDATAGIVPEKHRGDVRSGNIVALQAPCGYDHCIRPGCYKDGRENPCMMDIGVEDVSQAVAGLLKKNLP